MALLEMATNSYDALVCFSIPSYIQSILFLFQIDIIAITN